jgi:formamidopyrimidine-DNA glycosylase
MPELPEVETTRRGIAPFLEGRRISRVTVRERRLRWPIPPGIERRLAGAEIREVGRRAKYLLLRASTGTALVHLGMSGSLRILPRETPVKTHDHFDIEVDSGQCLRFNDPRRFGSLLWTEENPELHPLLSGLGPEPFSAEFTGGYLRRRGRGRRVGIKHLIMDAHVVVGVGNIYASEALFRAGINPKRAAGRLSAAVSDQLVVSIREVLDDALRFGGTTLRDYYGGNGEPGYFARELRVYEKTGDPCTRCGAPIRHFTQGQRSTYYCPRCQR